MKGISLAVLLLAGCATGYQPSGITGGFEDRLVSRNPLVYEIRFLGNGTTSQARARDFVLLRAAELTIASGHDHFVINRQASGVGSDEWFDGAEFQGTVFNPRTSVLVQITDRGLDACAVVQDVVASHGVKPQQLERTTTIACRG